MVYRTNHYEQASQQNRRRDVSNDDKPILTCELFSDEKEPQKYKGVKQSNMSSKIETNAGESIEVPTYAFLIFDVSVVNGVNQV